ncbi:response regulator [Desulfonatronum sp. SC1]|uniref:hybrid sensor histidine kinase/response regulator n=1 Tax=Desulfonatronum sp. SC1 TaxID=2109626 RepID=UPI0013047D00|nr:response regulator [Desulfonatronum sp. SC1]
MRDIDAWKKAACTILVIDDEPRLRHGLCSFLEDMDHPSVEAGNGLQGLKILRETPGFFVAVIVDLRMPVMDGYAFIEHAVLEFPDLPIIVLSGVGTIEDALRAIRLGAWDFITKPLMNSAILEHALNKALERASLLRQNKRQQRQLENSLRESEDRFTKAFLYSPAALIISNLRSGRLIDVNDRCVNIFGFSRAEVIGRRLTNLGIWTDPDDPGRLLRLLQHEDAFRDSPVVFSAKSGRRLSTFVSAVKLSLAGRQVVLTMIDDETQRRMAMAASQAKSDFLAGMSHEIRTPMNGVVGMAEMLLDSNLTGDQRRMVETIETSGKALLNLINDILDFSKIEAGHFSLDIQDFDLSQILDDCATIISVQAQRKNLRFSHYIAPNVPLLLQGDPGRLRQILLNLAGNAVKFTEKGEVRIDVGRVMNDEDSSGFRSQVSALSPSENEVLLLFTVSDTGIGIAEDKLGAIFDRYSQAESSIFRRFGGTGLGLAISRQLAEMMGGEIGVRSILGQGSEFWFTAVFHGAAVQADPWRGNTISNRSVDLPTFHGHVLVAEDNAVNQQVILRMLHRLSVTADLASTGLQALESLKRKNYDLVLMDVEMPEMDGLATTREIRKAEDGRRTSDVGDRISDLQVSGLIPHPSPRLPIIAMTAGVSREDRVVCFAAGMDDYLTKPMILTDLARVLGKWLPRRGRDDEAKELCLEVHQEAKRAGLESPDATPLGRTSNAYGNGLKVAPRVPLVSYPMRNFGELLGRLAGDEETALWVQRTFLEQLPERVAELERLVAADQLRSAVIEAHALKGSALNAGFPALAESARRIEEAGRTSGKPGIEDHVSDLLHEVRRTLMDQARWIQPVDDVPFSAGSLTEGQS